ncbi:MAG: helix-hairpin-helix domain-containing protein [Erythrobacter sp.]|nr:helix-hairpin-helix domain-containing protein [Erythrobacter sp.]
MTLNEVLPYVLAGLAILLLFVAFYFLANRKTTVVAADKRAGTTDVLDEGAERAKRNEALINAPSAATNPAAAPAPAPVATPAPVASSEPAPEPAPAPNPAPMPETAPEPAPEPSPAPVATTATDDLTTIKGLGPKLATMLNEQGITSFAQIAEWDDAEVARIDSMLGRFKGRITRDSWVEQAKMLAAGDESGFEDKFGRNG